MATVTIEIPDEVLGLAANPQQIESEVLQAALAFWIARVMVANITMSKDLLSRLISVIQEIRNTRDMERT